MMERRFPCGGREKASILGLITWVWVCNALAAGSSLTSNVGHYMYTPKQITVEQAKQFLSTLEIGTLSHLPKTDGLFITADPSELEKAIGVLAVADATEPYVIRFFDTSDLPSADQIIAAVGGIAVGSLTTKPSGSGVPVLVDRHHGKAMVVAPSRKVDQIAAVLCGSRVAEAPSSVEPTVGIAPNTQLISMTGLSKPQLLAASAEPAASATVKLPQSSQRITGGSPKLGSTSKIGDSASAGNTSFIQDYQSPEIANGEQELSLNLKDKVSIEELLTLVGEYLHLDYMYDPADVQGEVMLKLQGDLRGKMKVKDLYPMLESVLKFKNIVMTRKGNLITLVKSENAMDIDPKIRTAGGTLEFGDAVITRVFNLRYIDTSNAENLLNQMRLVVGIASIPETKTMVITSFSYRMSRVEELLDLVDKPGEPKQFRFRQLKYTMARTLTEKVQALAEQLGAVQISVSSSSAAPAVLGRQPNESEVAYRARLLAMQQRAAAEAAARARQPAAPTQTAQDSVFLDSDERTNRILMIGREEQLAVVERLVETLDVAQQDLRTLKLHRLEYVDAEDTRRKLEQLGIVDAGDTSSYYSGRITDPRTAQVPGQPSVPQPPMPIRARISGSDETSLAEAPQVIVVEATNSLLVNATAEQHLKIEDILKYLDSQTLDETVKYVIYPLENQDPEEMAGVLDKLIKETVTGKDGKIQEVINKTEDQITIVPDKNTFSLVVYASRKNQEWISSLIKAMDKRRPQVLIDVTLVEVSKNDAFNYDLNLITAAPDLSKASGLIGTGGVIPGGLKTGNILQAASGAFTGFYGDDHVNLLLSAMQSKNYGRILAKPKILVNDNEKGTIVTKETTYVAKRSSVPRTSGGTGTQESYVETSLDFAPYDAGITLDITPHISEGELLRLDVALTRSDFLKTTKAVPVGQSEPPPDTSSSDIKTVVTVPDKSTIILGGMVKLNQTKGGSKVPILGDLPGLGALFRGVKNDDTEKKLYVFVKAEVIRPMDFRAGDSEMTRISEQNREAFEKVEAEFQNHQTVPGVKSKPMSPTRVLDAR